MSTKLSGIKTYALQKGDHYMTLDIGYTYSDGSLHKGIDIIGNPNVNNGYDYIVAVAAGKVIAYCNTIEGVIKDTGTKGCGNYVTIETDDGYRWRYMHMTKGSVKVKTGDYVKQGQVIGYMGCTGNSTGRHLHLDVSRKGKLSGGYYVSSQDRTYFDPKTFLRQTTDEVKTTPTTPAKTSKTGTYKVKKDVNVRSGAGTKYSRVKYNGYTANAKQQILNIKGKAVDYFPKGMSLSITQVSSDGAWGKCPSGWVSMNYLTKT